ncbi:hypothetical protein A2U01_0109010, partial [Trifolium medium]|nr:hypothetical protein [Trifolium medium]
MFGSRVIRRSPFKLLKITVLCLGTKVVKIAIQIVESCVFAILQGSSVPEYGRNRFLVDAGG